VPSLAKRFTHRAANLFLRLKGERGYLYQFAHDLTGALGGLLLLPAIRAFKPDIIIVPDRGAPSAFWPSMPNSKILFLSHHNPMRFINNPLIGSLSEEDARYAVKVENLALKRSHAVVCPSRYMKDVFSQTYPFSGIVNVIPNVADEGFILSMPPVDIKSKLDLPPEAPVIYIPSASSLVKGKLFVFEIVRRIALLFQKQIGFYLSGIIDDDLHYLLSHIPENARIYAPGHLSYADIIAVVKGCDLCISPTVLENFGMALLEAVFCGLPVVSFDIGGNRELIQDGATGFLAPFPDVGALIEKSLSLLNDGGMRASFSKESEDFSLSTFSSDKVLRAYERLFQRLES
jgi:glycosyltransferase involved in cell wall biosynthesis